MPTNIDILKQAVARAEKSHRTDDQTTVLNHAKTLMLNLLDAIEPYVKEEKLSIEQIQLVLESLLGTLIWNISDKNVVTATLLALDCCERILNGSTTKTPD